MDKYDTSQLTEFPRFEEETPQSGVTTFFNKIWKLPLFSPSETSENLHSKASSDSKQDAPQTEAQNKEEYDDSKTETGAFAVELEGRSLPNVLRRISSLIALGSGASTRYADTELARYWMPDDVALECYECAARFSALRRRHHCRVCGQIFCSRCCSQRVPGHIFGCTGGLRVCTYCCNVVLSYLKENELSGEMSTDLRALQENLQIKFPTPLPSQGSARGEAGSGRSGSFMFAREDERASVLVTHSVPLHDIYKQLLYQLPTSLHRYRLVRYSGVWRGCELLQWMMDHTSNKSRALATQVCQSLLRGGWIASVTELPHFADYALYRPAMLPNTDTDTPDEENNRLVESVSSYCLDLNVEDSSARLIRTAKPESNSTPPSEEEQPVAESFNENANEEAPVSQACRSVCISGAEHLQLLLRQCLARAALPAAWAPVLHQLVARAAAHTQPDIYGTDIDIRNYVQVKKIPDGDMKDSCVVPGVVITKNVAHRGMPQQLSNPTVLLLDCSIAYQRVEGKLTSLEPVLLQEQEYLSRCAARIRALGARLVLVRGSAARGVQDALRVCGVSLAQNVRVAALRRTARCARADLLASIDARIGTPRLGTCTSFYVTNFPSKTVIVLEGCAEPNLGCCILLRGASLQELVRVKKVVKFMLLAYYNWKLEKSFLGDIEAVLPEAGATFEDDNTENEVLDEEKDKETVNDDDEHENDEAKNNDDTSEQSQNNEEDESDLNKEQKTIEDNDKQKMSAGIDDPLQKPKFVRKADDRNSSCTVPIRDFSDPLRSNMSVDDEVFPTKVEENLIADETNDRWSTDDAVLSMSPNVVIPAPQQRMPARAPPHKHTTPHTSRPTKQTEVEAEENSLEQQHPFIKQPITTFADDLALRTSLAHYRATGGGINGHLRGCPFYNPSIIKKEVKEPAIDTDREETLDPLAPQHHQQLSILLYSFSPKSPNVPDFCVNPWIVTMEMYGRNDISLGGFLEKYCFNGEYKCSSNNCNVATNQHIRKFVHEDVCITISCTTVGHSNVDKLREEQSKHVMFWSRCERCGAVSHARRLSSLALGLSLAQYVRLRCAAPRYARARVCRHPLHAHAHAFVHRLTTATFRYSKISQFEIALPPAIVAPRYDTALMRDALISQLNDLMLRGHETFSGVPDSEADKDYQAFKQHMEQIHLALTSSHLQEQTSFAAVVKSLWNVSDRIIFGEKMLRDAQEKWSCPVPKPNKTQPDSSAEDRSDLEESSDTGNSDNGGTTYTFESKETEREHGGEDDEERGDKKTVRQILTQLLSNSTNSNQSMIVSGGVVPVQVLAGEIGSVIAATLASVTYLRSLRAHTSTQSEQEEADSTAKDKTDGDKKAAKSNDHIGVLLKDGLICRVYYATQFLKLRHALLAPLARNPHISDGFARHTNSASVANEAGARCLCDEAQEKGDYKSLCDIEEGFIRSLAHCVPWAARGGKSGSTFCKTKDDRYVLKEMTKQEWQRFLEFAPHYFSYVNTCRQNGQPSLLARILGVFGVGGAGPGVLVMENIWWGCDPYVPRYDLKGCQRRGFDPAPAPLQHQPAVLLDDGLLHCRWESPLFVSGWAGARLRLAADRDTAFLAAHGVMDYSLLLGVDGRRLVLGLIDYIRTFTWDKKLEHLVKKNLGSGQPTVVSPEEYKRRFSVAIGKYFLECPAHWDHLLSPANEEERT